MNQKCFSRSGWWQTLCGLDAANQGFGWTSNVDDVGCRECRTAIRRGVHEQRPVNAYLKPKSTEIEQTRQALEADHQAAGATLTTFPRGTMGLTPDATKRTPEWQAAKARYDQAFAALRRFNTAYPPSRSKR